jgi:hypothetical protein
MKIHWFALLRLYILTTSIQLLLLSSGYNFLTAVVVTVIINLVYPEDVVTFKRPE